MNAALGPLFTATLGFPLAARLVLSAAAIAPVGFAMGLCFPLGMLRFGDRNKPWFWALNGAAGVLASAVSLALSMEIGFAKVAYLGAAAYGIAHAAFRRPRAGVSGAGHQPWTRTGSSL
jgi:hypothetical protein